MHPPGRGLNLTGVNETWLHAHNTDQHEIERCTANHVHRPDGKMGGSVAIHILSDIPSVTISELCFSVYDLELAYAM